MFDFIAKWFTSLASSIISVLPQDPFISSINSLTIPDGMGYFAYFFPISDMITIFGLWISAYTTYLIYSVIARWSKIIQ